MVLIVTLKIVSQREQLLLQQSGTLSLPWYTTGSKTNTRCISSPHHLTFPLEYSLTLLLIFVSSFMSMEDPLVFAT